MNEEFYIVGTDIKVKVKSGDFYDQFIDEELEEMLRSIPPKPGKCTYIRRAIFSKIMERNEMKGE